MYAVTQPQEIESMVSAYEQQGLARQAGGPWLPVGSWGCGMYSVLHVPTGAVLYDAGAACLEARSLQAWFERWLAGETLLGQAEGPEPGEDYEWFEPVVPWIEVVEAGLGGDRSG